MGPWSSAVVAVAALIGVFFAVMGFRGLVDMLENFSGECAGCGRTSMVPLPPDSHRCWRCHYAGTPLLHLFARGPQLHH